MQILLSPAKNNLMRVNAILFIIALLLAFFSARATVHNVSVTNNVFTPANLSIQQGDTVLWTNMAGFHNVNGSLATYPSNPVGFSNGPASASMWTYQFVFNVSGTYDYQCDPHAGVGMVGTITVQAAAQGLPFQSFEKGMAANWSFRVSPAPYNTEGLADDFIGGSEDVWDSIQAFSGDIDTSSEGIMFWGMQDLDNSNGGGALVHTLTFDSVDVSGYATARIVFDYYTLGFDGSDSIGYQTRFLGVSNTWNPQVDLNKDSQAWTTVSIPVPAGATYAQIRINTAQNGSSDFAGIDNFRIDTTAAPVQPGIPTYSIASISSADAQGVADSLNVECKIEGVVYTIDFDGNNGYSFFVQDASGGINVWNSSDVSGYNNPTIGDSLRIIGEIIQFNGLIEMNPDSIVVLGSGAAFAGPQVVTVLDESTEGEFVEFRGARLVDATQWPTSTGSQNVDITNGRDTITIRIDSDTDIDGTPAPNVVFNVRGAGGQFDPSNPYTEGYQLFPRFLDDIDTVPASTLPLYDIADITTNDANFVPDSNNVACLIRGVVHSIDFDGNNGLNFFVYDNTGGMNVYSPVDLNYYNQVNLGDSLAIFGQVGQFRGLTQMEADSIVIVGRTTLVSPQVVSQLDESTEGEYIEVQGYSLITPSQWPGAGSSASVDITNGSDTLVLRIDSDTDIDGSPVPSTSFDVIGAGGQFTFASPANDGYQIQPSSLANFTFAPPSVPTVNFDRSSDLVREDVGTVNVSLSIAPPATGSDTIFLQAALGVGVTVPGDGNISPLPNIVTGLFELPISSGDDSTGFIISIVDDALLEGDETLFVDVVGTSAGVLQGLNLSYQLVVQDNDRIIPTYNIADVSTNDASGVADSLGVECKLVGTVFTDDFDGNNGYSFYIYDNTGGINIWNFNDVSGYQATRGDSIRVIGAIEQFNGLTELAVDSIVLLASNRSLKAPELVFDLNEDTESEYIRLNGFYLVDPSQWPNQGFSQNLEITNGRDTLVMRIDSDTDIDGSVPPTGYFDLIGVGNQFDNTGVPLDGGYQFFPRDTNDIIPVQVPQLRITEVMPSSGLSGSIDGDWFEVRNIGTANVDLQGLAWDDESREIDRHPVNTGVVLAPGEAAIFLEASTGAVGDWELEWKQNGNGLIILNEGNQFDNGFSGLSSGGDEVNLYDAEGRLISFAAYPGSAVTGGFSLEFDQQNMLLGAAVDGVNGAYTSVNGDVGSPGDLRPVGLVEARALGISVYPNPSRGAVTIAWSHAGEKNWEVLNTTGQIMAQGVSTDQQWSLDLQALPKGAYWLRLSAEGEIAALPLILR